MSYKLDLDVKQWGKGINKNVDRNSNCSTKIGNMSVQIDILSIHPHLLVTMNIG